MTQKEAGPMDLPVMQKETVARLMALHDHASEVRHTQGAPAYNVKATVARAAIETALRELLEQSVIVPEPPCR